MSLDYDLSGFLGAGSQLNWPNTASPQPHAVANQLTSQRQQTGTARSTGHALAASHTLTSTGIGHSGHGAGHQPAKPKKLIKQHKAVPFGEKAF
jgi:hypothetical protein